MKQYLLKLLLVMLCCMIGNVASGHDFEAVNSEGVTIYYIISSSKTVGVSYRGNSYDEFDNEYSGTVNIPKTVSYNGTTYSVTSIEEWAFYDCIDLTSIEIPNSVTSIGEAAFAYCPYLTNIEIPNSVTIIGSGAFNSCSMASIVIPNSVLLIGQAAFANCSNLTNIEIPNSVTIIAAETFSSCLSLTSIEIPNSVTSIGNHAFANCSYLTSIEIPSSVTEIGHNALQNCPSLTSIVVDADNANYDSRDNCNAIIDKSSNTLIIGCPNSVIPNSVTSIGEAAFANCSYLTNIEIPNSVTSIGSGAFNSCSSLASIKIPNSVTSIGNSAFRGCSRLSKIHWTPNAETDLSSSFSNAYLTSTRRTLYLYKNPENAAMVDILVSSLDGKFKEIIVVDQQYDLTVTNAGMSTLYLDYPIVVPDDDNLLGVFYVYQIDGNIMLLKRLRDYIPANNGVIVMANAGTFTFNGTGDVVAEITDNQLQGVTESTPVSSIDGTVYTLGRGINSGYFGFHKYTGANIPANKAFLVRNASSGVNSFNLVLDNEDGTSTSIGHIENGKFVPESNVIYDLQGRRVENPSKGIYIVNGKKQYIK